MPSMSNKERTLIAVDMLIDRYENNAIEWVRSGSICDYLNCPLCKIHRRVQENNECAGCPVANEWKTVGCTRFRSWRMIHRKLHEMNDEKDKSLHAKREDEFKAACVKRAEFWRWLLPTLKEWPLSRFTRKGWKYAGIALER